MQQHREMSLTSYFNLSPADQTRSEHNLRNDQPVLAHDPPSRFQSVLQRTYRILYNFALAPAPAPVLLNKSYKSFAARSISATNCVFGMSVREVTVNWR